MTPRNMQGTMKECLIWMFGRGASISCGLTWYVPDELRTVTRDEQIKKIKESLSQEMQEPHINTEPYRLLLTELAARTNPNWSHLFVTTNWDTLLEQEIERLNLDELSYWLQDSLVFHYNGSIEGPSNQFRTPFLLETDSASQRNPTVEGNIAFNRMIWQRYFIVVGMSFECPTDRFLLDELGSVENQLPIGESNWIILNPDEDALDAVCNRIQAVLPAAKIFPVEIKFEEWLSDGISQLVDWGVVSER